MLTSSLRHYVRAARPAHFLRHSSTLAQLEESGSRILRVIKGRVQERVRLQGLLTETLSTPEDIANLRRLKETEPIQEAWDEWSTQRELLNETTPLLQDPDQTMRSLAVEEYESLSTSLENIITKTFPSLLIPPSTTSHLSALVELKSGVGGAEASLFLAEMLRMYTRFATANRWKITPLTTNELETGGVKDAIIEVKGSGAYDALKWESGVHRVQRVPSTDSSGRVHTSTVTVITLPLIEEKDAQQEQLYSMDDVKIEVMRARGAGGQHVNKTESAVRLTHIPSGITVSMQDERSQHTNKRRAFQVLASRLMDAKLTKEIADRRATKNSLVQSADRSEKIRTYNFAQERVTDHRINLSIKNLTSVLEGDSLEDFVRALQKNEDESAMEQMMMEAESLAK